MAQSDARFGYKADLKRTDHNLSQPLGFTSACGMLLPIWFDFATPGDSYYMQHDLPLLRSNQFLAPAMIDVKVHYETFFVPLQMIYQAGENTLFSLDNIQSSMYIKDYLRNNDFPLFDYSNYIDNLLSVDDVENKSVQHADAFRLADLFGLQPNNFLSSPLVTKYIPNFFPYQILAYNTIFQYYYRLDDKSSFTNSQCNIDYYYGQQTAEFGPTFMTVHQRPWDFDYFMSMYRSPIISAANTQDILSSKEYSPLVESQISPLIKQGYYFGDPNSPFGDFTNDKITSFGGTLEDGAGFNSLFANMNGSTAFIRQMFANEKLAMISGRTRKNYDSQVLAHYGVSVPHDVKHDLTMIHHDTYDLNVQEVTSLASTDDAPLGELAGKSFCAGRGDSFKFTAPCHGVIMTIFSIEPKKRYITGFDRINAITNAYDLPTPEFDRLGNIPMFRYEVGYRQELGSRRNTDIIGWKERYYQFKRKPAKLSYAFFGANGVNNFGAYFIGSLPFGSARLTTGDSILGYEDPRPDLEERFYIERGALDSQCLVPYFSGWKHEDDGENWDANPWLIYSRDPFIVNSHIKCKKVSWMSKDGEPIYNF